MLCFDLNYGTGTVIQKPGSLYGSSSIHQQVTGAGSAGGLAMSPSRVVRRVPKPYLGEPDSSVPECLGGGELHVSSAIREFAEIRQSVCGMNRGKKPGQ